MRGIGWAFNALGAISSAIALISLTQRVFEIGLVPYLSELVELYRALVRPAVELLAPLLAYVPPIFGVKLGEWTIDLWIISFAAAAGLSRGWIMQIKVSAEGPDAIEVPAWFRPYFPIWVFLGKSWLALVMTLVLGGSMGGIIFLLLSPFYIWPAWSATATEEDRAYAWANLSMLTGLGGAVAFFALNAALANG